MKVTYDRLASSEDGEEAVELEKTGAAREPLTLKSRSSSLIPVVVTALVALCAGVVGGYVYGSTKAAVASNPHAFTLQPDYVEQSFQYNRSFAERPSPETDGLWDTVFPPHGGFFHDPEMSDVGMSLAVYHQLHCLDGIRHAYWTIYDALQSNETINMDNLPDYSTPWHTRHCIDFLRQMLMCNADTTIEFVKPKLGGIIGFGLQHQCKRWDQIHDWVIDKQALGNPNRNNTAHDDDDDDDE